MRLILAMAVTAVLAGCESGSSFGVGEAMQMQLAGSWPFEVVGHSADYAQVWSGGGTSTGSGSRFDMTIEPGGATCQGSGSGIAGDSNAWRNHLRCADGRAADFIIRRPFGLAKVWAGDGRFSDGTAFSWEESSAVGALEARLAQFRLAQGRPAAPPAVVASARPPRPATTSPEFRQAPERTDDVAVIIGNGGYAKFNRDIPDVKPAHADAEGIRLYATRALGVRDGNVLLIKDATAAQMVEVFGSERDHRGTLFTWVKPGRSRVFVYYSGHGAPVADGRAMLVPADASAARIALSGYSLDLLYRNLGKLPVDSVTVVLEACFSGVSPAGSVLGKASPVFLDVKAPPVPANLTVIAAGAANQIASWEPDDSHGLFTRHFLDAMSGKADFDKDGKVGLDELDRYLKDTLSYFAGRHYGRDQEAQIIKGGGR
ncbi:MAG: caspase family protein [Magnetospirillum sp.]|nr:MAG: caspase family protein [Magnetospirillum sp.]